MSVLVEGHSIVACIDAIERACPGGVALLAAQAPNRSFCADPWLFRVGFLRARDAAAYAAVLRRAGLAPEGPSQRGAFVRVVQGEPCEPCSWLDVAVLELDASRHLTLAARRGMPNVGMAVPMGWEWHDSATAAPHLLGAAPPSRTRATTPRRRSGRAIGAVLVRDLAGQPQQTAQPAVPAIEFARCVPDGVRDDLAPAAR